MGAAPRQECRLSAWPALSPLLRGPCLQKCGFSLPPRMDSLLPTTLSQGQGMRSRFSRPPFPRCQCTFFPLSPAEHRYSSHHSCECIMCGPAATLCLPQDTSLPGPFFSSLCQHPHPMSMPTSLAAARCYPTLPMSSVPLTLITLTSTLLGTRNNSLHFPPPYLSPACLVNASLRPLGPPYLPTVPFLLVLHWKLPS